MSALEQYQWQPGQSGNPAGRPVGSRHRFGERFMRDALEVWEKHGKAALEDMAINDKSNFVKAMVVAPPKNVPHQTAREELDRLTSEKTRELLEWIRAMKAKTIDATEDGASLVAWMMS